MKKGGAASHLRNSHRYYNQLVAPPPLNSPSSFSECDARLSTFSPEPLRPLPGAESPPACGAATPTSSSSHQGLDNPWRPLEGPWRPTPPPTIAENEAYQSDNASVASFQTFQQQHQHNNIVVNGNGNKRPASLYSEDTSMLPPQPHQRPQRPTSLFKAPSPGLTTSTSLTSCSSLITPTGDPQKRLASAVFLHQHNQNGGQNSTSQPPAIHRRFADSLSELSNSNNAMIRPNCLTRRTSYRTYQKVPIPVAAPMSPVGSDYSFDLKSPTSSQCFSPLPRLEAVSEVIESTNTGTVFEKTYESLKSTTSSQNSSKASSASSDLSTSAASSTYNYDTSNATSNAKNLNFVSPKTGVYRPMPDKRQRANCRVM